VTDTCVPVEVGEAVGLVVGAHGERETLQGSPAGETAEAGGVVGPALRLDHLLGSGEEEEEDFTGTPNMAAVRDTVPSYIHNMAVG